MSNALTLASLLPAPGAPPLTPDEVLSRFVSYVEATGLSLYPAQEEAILELVGGKHVILNTPTGSGKSLVATALHFKATAEGRRSFYTCPIKALVNEKFFALCQAFGADKVGMVTGDATINRDAPIVCCTAEVLANLVLREPKLTAPYVVMDEFHYYADKERGIAWQIPLLLLEGTTFLLMSATLGDMKVISESLHSLTRREVAYVHSAHRPVPLEYTYQETPLHETIEELINRGRFPVYLVNFTQRAAAEQAQNLMSVNFLVKEEKEQIRAALQDFRFDTPYGKDFQRYIRHGIGLHHAGLLPKYRLLVEKLAQQGVLKVVSGTDTLGVGVNIPIRTVLFSQLCKFDGEKVGILSVRDFKQVSGRAGRKGFDDRGFVVVQAPEHAIENLRLEEKKAAGKKVVKKQPPQKGYIHWDRTTFDRLLERQPEPLESRFQISHGMLLNLLQAEESGLDNGYRRLITLIDRSHSNDYLKRKFKKEAAAAFRTLVKANILQHVKGSAFIQPHVKVSPDLQKDFSLNHTLSLYLMETLPKLERELETYPLDVLTLVESILENPDVVLYAQLHKAKGEKINELKAAGVEYDQRMEQLEDVEWPKPHRDFIYFTFNEFAAKHPWIGQENIRPKSIAREMFETCSSFHDYVRDYGLQRSEGVLLRYLSSAYKTLVQNVPEAFKTEEIEDIVSHLRVSLRTVDSSLVDEWERMKDPAYLQAASTEVTLGDRPRSLADDPKRLTIRIRTDVHRLLKAISTRNYEEAASCVYQRQGDEPFTPERFEKSLAPYWADSPKIDVTPKSRRPDKTIVTSVEKRLWEVRHKIVDHEGNDDWMLDCVVDLREERADDLPLIELRRIGT